MAKAKKEGDLFIASVLHVPRGEATDPITHQKTTIVKTIDAGQMVSDTDLKPDEIKQFKALGVLRYPTQAEQAAMDAKAERDEAAEAAGEASTEAALLAQRQAAERDELDVKAKADAVKGAAELAEKQEKERTAAAGKGKKK